MKGILKLAYKLVVNDKSKFTALLVGITFAVFLMMFITSMFVGVLNHSAATVINIDAPIWIMDPAVETPANTIGLPDYVLDAVRSMQGVKYAVPLYAGGALLKLADGSYQSVQSAMPISPNLAILTSAPNLSSTTTAELLSASLRSPHLACSVCRLCIRRITGRCSTFPIHATPSPTFSSCQKA